MLFATHTEMSLRGGASPLTREVCRVIGISKNSPAKVGALVPNWIADCMLSSSQARDFAKVGESYLQSIKETKWFRRVKIVRSWGW